MAPFILEGAAICLVRNRPIFGQTCYSCSWCLMYWCPISHCVKAKEPFTTKEVGSGHVTMQSSHIKYHTQTISLAEQRNSPCVQLIGFALWGWGTVPQDAGFPIARPHTVEARVALLPSLPVTHLGNSSCLCNSGFLRLTVLISKTGNVFHQGTQELGWNISYSCYLGTLARRQHSMHRGTVLAEVNDPDHCCYIMRARRNILYPSGVAGCFLVLSCLMLMVYRQV